MSYSRSTKNFLSDNDLFSVTTMSVYYNQTAKTPEVASQYAIALLSIMFFLIGIIGIAGNIIIIYIVLSKQRMRQSATNLFIMNMAFSDLFIMIFGIPDIVMFMLNQGWLLNEGMCKVTRYVMVFSLYSSVMTAVGVCIERYIAICFPIRARIYCNRKRIWIIILCIWPTVLSLGLPTVLYVRVQHQPDTLIPRCKLVFPNPAPLYQGLYRYMELFLFYLLPMIIQIVCYSITCKKLFTGTDHLHGGRLQVNGSRRSNTDNNTRSRKGVVKMLISSVLIYFISYSPHQVLLLYNTFSKSKFGGLWIYIVFTTAMGYINSACNPILYCIFCQNFRNQFKRILICKRDEELSSSRVYTRVPLQGIADV